MSRSLPPLGWFRAFEAAARHLSFTQAADELGLTQSAVSQQIKSLESRLGCRLFVRKHRAIALTDDGRRLLPEVSQAMSSLRSVTAAFEQPMQTRTLNVATSVSVAEWFIAPNLKHFLAAQPEVSVRLLTSVWPDELAVTSADVFIHYGADHELGVDSEQLGSDQLLLVASPALLQSREDVQLSTQELESFTLIQAVGTSDVWSNCAVHFGYDPLHEAVVHVDTHGLAVDFALSGTGIALTSQLIATPSLANGSLIRAHPLSMTAKDSFRIARTLACSSDAAQPFIDWLQSEVETNEKRLNIFNCIPHHGDNQ